MARASTTSDAFNAIAEPRRREILGRGRARGRRDREHRDREHRAERAAQRAGTTPVPARRSIGWRDEERRAAPVRRRGWCTNGHGRRHVTATVSGRPRPATNRAVLARFARRPFMAQRVSALIRVHGIWLWLRRLPVHPRTTPLPLTVQEPTR